MRDPGVLEMRYVTRICRFLGGSVVVAEYLTEHAGEVSVLGYRCCRGPKCASVPETLRRRCRFFDPGGDIDPVQPAV
jgi:hypothetical protein